MKEDLRTALFWRKETVGKKAGVRCELCARRCLIPEGGKGFCTVRENRKNKLLSMNYGKVVALNVDPVEKKPLFHFHPGSFALSYACAGCNWRCKYCCNWSISQIESMKDFWERYEPEKIVEMAEEEDMKIISHTYTEPTVFFEFAFDVARIAHRKKIKNTFVTNGYIAEEPLRKISRFLDATTVDFKASGDEDFLKKHASVPSINPVFETLKLMKKLKIHVEITDLVIPKIGDSRKKLKDLAGWVLNELGQETPFHIIRFFPSYKMGDFVPTPVSTLENFAKDAKEIGLKYVYVGNVEGHKWENTYCPSCGGLLVERIGFSVSSRLLKERCPACGARLEGFVM